MIIKGGSVVGASLATHLMKPENDRVDVFGLRGEFSTDLHDVFDTWRASASVTACQKPLYHAQLNPTRDLRPEEWEQAIAIFEQTMGLEDRARVAVLHDKNDREHVHLVYNRIDTETMRVWSDSWNYAKHEKAAREIERVLGLERVPGVLIERDDQPRPERTPSHADMQQGQRTGIDPRAVKAEVSALYQQAEDGRALVQSLDEAGYVLARGDKRGYVILDDAGGVHNLARRAGAKAGELRDMLADYPLASLPGVEEAREMHQDRAQGRTPARDRVAWDDAVAAAGIAKEQREGHLIAPEIDDEDQRDRTRAARLGATLYDRADLVHMQRDAMRDVREHARLNHEQPQPERPRDEERPEISREMSESAIERMANQAGKELTERDRWRIALDAIRECSGLTAERGEGRERDLER